MKRNRYASSIDVRHRVVVPKVAIQIQRDSCRAMAQHVLNLLDIGP